jgi:hypothetical protein
MALRERPLAGYAGRTHCAYRWHVRRLATSPRQHGWCLGVTGRGTGVGQTQRSSAPVLLPYQPEVSLNEGYVGPLAKNG